MSRREHRLVARTNERYGSARQRCGLSTDPKGSFMAPKVHLDVRLTLPEARAIARLVKQCRNSSESN